MTRKAADLPIKVLLIEDSLDDAELIVHELSRGGYVPAVERIETREEMKQMLGSRQWDVIISDYKPLHLSAMEALRFLQKNNLDLPFIILSSSDIGEDMIVEVLKAGAHDYVLKNRIWRLVPAVTRELKDAAHRKEAKNAEAALNEEHAHHRILMETAAKAGIGIAIIRDIKEQEMVVVYINSRLLEMLGYKEKHVVGKLVLDFIVPEHHAIFHDYYRAKLNGQASRDNIEVTLKCKDDTFRPVAVVASRTIYQGGNAIVTYVNDISELLEAGRRERELKALQEIDSLRSQLIANVSHELRTPLTSIKGFVSTLLRKDIEWSEEEKTDFLQTIALETERLTALINDTLDISRIEAGTLSMKRGYYTVNTIIDSVRNILFDLTSGHLMEIKIAKDLPLLFVDKSRIGQVLINLTENAVKYSPRGTTVTLNAQMSEEGRYIVISINDQGTGISPELQEKVFDRFFQADMIVSGKKSGTGLGLSICRGIIEAHGGSIWVKSKLGTGSTFNFSIPVTLMEELYE